MAVSEVTPPGVTDASDRLLASVRMMRARVRSDEEEEVVQQAGGVQHVEWGNGRQVDGEGGQPVGQVDAHRTWFGPGPVTVGIRTGCSRVTPSGLEQQDREGLDYQCCRS